MSRQSWGANEHITAWGQVALSRGLREPDRMASLSDAMITLERKVAKGDLPEVADQAERSCEYAWIGAHVLRLLHRELSRGTYRSEGALAEAHARMRELFYEEDLSYCFRGPEDGEDKGYWRGMSADWCWANISIDRAKRTLWRIARNCEIDEARKVARTTSIEDWSGRVEFPLDRVADRDALNRALATLAAQGRLSDRDREILTLRFVRDLGPKEAACALGISYVAVTQATSRLCRKLGTEMAREAEGVAIDSHAA